MKTNGLLYGKVLMVAGGGSQVGRWTALVVAREGATVVIADVNEGSGLGTVAAIEIEGGEADFMYTDLRHSGQVQATLGRIVRKYGRLDGAFDCTGLPVCTAMPPAPPLSFTNRRVRPVNGARVAQ